MLPRWTQTAAHFLPARTSSADAGIITQHETFMANWKAAGAPHHLALSVFVATRLFRGRRKRS